ncbi:hypothetical protein IE81DRAFT_116339 [Ceraceosorus guamensis]|uniref:Uncharacterized protein n=1 Tax=Ceraceosorus guamensis TaxID=1522189 RepID=A0A316VZC1_9BASI|nr:hypothetical protein IE81DRAFT_116339 [Ceraceosorus guamensis]PWN42812.1 hypothetical protein IE81DRAFT_116339 [Ceraceosorus guamensis]
MGRCSSRAFFHHRSFAVGKVPGQAISFQEAVFSFGHDPPLELCLLCLCNPHIGQLPTTFTMGHGSGVMMALAFATSTLSTCTTIHSSHRRAASAVMRTALDAVHGASWERGGRGVNMGRSLAGVTCRADRHARARQERHGRIRSEAGRPSLVLVASATGTVLVIDAPLCWAREGAVDVPRETRIRMGPSWWLWVPPKCLRLCFWPT